MQTFDSLIRVSKMGGRLESAESTMTVADQRDANAHVIRARGARLGMELKALDQSGHTVTESPAWQQALVRCQAGESNGIVVAYGDRLSRNWRTLGGFLEALEAAGAEVIIAGMPNLDYRNEDGRGMIGMMAVMSDMQWQAASTRNKRIAAAALARGVPNRVPYGYMRNGTFDDKVCVGKVDPELDGKALVPHPVHADVVRLIFKLRGDRWSWAQIADELEQRGVPTPRGAQRWVGPSLHGVIANRAYVGYVTLGEREPVLAHEPLVSEAAWRDAQAAQSTPRNGNLLGSLALGLVTCSSCGHVMSVLGAADGACGRRLLYACRRSSSDGKCSRPMAIKGPAVDEWVEQWVIAGIESEEPFDVFATARELAAARNALETATAARKRIVVTAAAWDPEDAEAAYRAAQENEVATREHYDELLARADGAAALPESADGWAALSLDAKRRVLRLLIARIDVAPPLSRSKFAPITDRLTLVAHGA